MKVSRKDWWHTEFFFFYSFFFFCSATALLPKGDTCKKRVPNTRALQIMLCLPKRSRGQKKGGKENTFTTTNFLLFLLMRGRANFFFPRRKEGGGGVRKRKHHAKFPKFFTDLLQIWRRRGWQKKKRPLTLIPIWLISEKKSLVYRLGCIYHKMSLIVYICLYFLEAN